MLKYTPFVCTIQTETALDEACQHDTTKLVVLSQNTNSYSTIRLKYRTTLWLKKRTNFGKL